MIHDIQNPTQALAILHEVSMYTPIDLTFVLDESLDPRDVPTCLSQCKMCDLTVDFKTDVDPVTKCPRCGETLEIIAIAELIIQGVIVIWRET